ncbi:NPCBM/NEW2 domain-containing protein [Myceligenerans indicum]|uniref:Glycosyl hydrolase family 98 putative carbohydrate-binding module domain-containing protein n=1 Tax=Myceligenerans indicum TaxID=2593663 RepID=A0ABS1LLI6_9MICO|nr:NPCBM/NEW2 domain-containing protein [Myceligenerans indicum]MBL0886884.1 hypothetical protein [Myceligenerans indicum]
MEIDEQTRSPTPTPDPSPSSKRSTDSATTPPSPSVASPSTLYLEDLDDSLIVTEPRRVSESQGRATINGVEYLDSLLYEYHNCSECEGSLEFIVPEGYSRLTGTVGLEDSSRHDDVIDGIVNFAVYDTSGNQIFPTTVIEYPEAVPVDVRISGQTRLRIEMTRGTNFETFVLGDMALVK